MMINIMHFMAPVWVFSAFLVAAITLIQYMMKQEKKPKEKPKSDMELALISLKEKAFRKTLIQNMSNLIELTERVKREFSEAEISENDILRQSLKTHIPKLCKSIHTIGKMSYSERNYDSVGKMIERLNIEFSHTLSSKAQSRIESIELDMASSLEMINKHSRL